MDRFVHSKMIVHMNMMERFSKINNFFAVSPTDEKSSFLNLALSRVLLPAPAVRNNKKKSSFLNAVKRVSLPVQHKKFSLYLLIVNL